MDIAGKTVLFKIRRRTARSYRLKSNGEILLQTYIFRKSYENVTLTILFGKKTYGLCFVGKKQEHLAAISECP